MVKCTIRNNSSVTEVKKCIVLADCNPPDKSSRNGNAAVTAGDMVSPVINMTGNNRNITNAYDNLCVRLYCDGVVAGTVNFR